MARQDYFIGLKPFAKNFVERTITVQETGQYSDPASGKTIGRYNRLTQIPMFRKLVTGTIWAKFSVGPRKLAYLYRYRDHDGNYYQEVVQAIVSHHGWWYFTALKDHNGVIVDASLWTQEEMAEATNQSTTGN